MSHAIIAGFDDIVGTFVHTRLGSRWIPNQGTAIGLVDTKGQLVAGVTYTLFNGVNVCMDVVGTGLAWCRPEFLYCWFSYPFDQLKCERVTAQVSSANTRSARFVEKLGFKLEATLERAFPNGDMLIYRMFHNECRYLNKPAKLPKVFTNG